MKRPEKTEYAEFYAGYVSLVPEIDILETLQKQVSEIQQIFAEISEEKGAYAYAHGKWTIRQLLGHLIDGERVFAYRALRISRNDKTPLAGFEENFYVDNSNFQNRTLADLTEEFVHLRRANNLLFQNLDDAAWDRVGIASDVEVSVRALAYIMVGHARHHANILKERYLN